MENPLDYQQMKKRQDQQKGKTMQKSEEKIILVTGGSQGLGEAIVRRLSAKDTTVIIADIKIDQAKMVADDIVKKGNTAMAYTLDVSNEKSVEKVFASLMEKYGKLDVLINNAGIDITKPFEEMTPTEFDRVIQVNLRGPFLMSKKAFPLMRKNGGHIINITSTAAKRAWPNATAYHASKWGLLGFSHALHTEGRPHNIKVTA